MKAATADGATTAAAAIGVDLGGSSVKAVAVDATGRILRRHDIPFNQDQAGDWARTIQKLLEELRGATGAAGAADAPIGLAAPGLAAEDGRSVAHMPGRLQGLEGLDWTRFLGVSRPVRVTNDAQAALAGEVAAGAGRGVRNAIMLTLGTGVGGAAMVDGRILRGAIGRAGHLGHVCLDVDGAPDICGIPGSLEDAIGNCTIRQRTGNRFNSTHDLLRAHAAGDDEAGRWWLLSVRHLACAIASFINVLDPERVIVGGGIAQAADALFDPLRVMVREREWIPGGIRVSIVPAELGEVAGAIGAAFTAMKGRPADHREA